MTKYIVILLFFASNIGIGQTNFTKKVINQYVDYLNQCNAYISASHYSVKDFNIELNMELASSSKPKSGPEFELKCLHSSSKCNLKINPASRQLAQIKLSKNIEKLENEAKIELKLELLTFQNHFDELYNIIQYFEGLTLDAGFYKKEENIIALFDNLSQYQKLITTLKADIRTASSLSAELFNESHLPFDILRSKRIVLASKALIQASDSDNPTKINAAIEHYKKAKDAFFNFENEAETREDDMAMYGYQDYFGHQVATKMLNSEKIATTLIFNKVINYQNPSENDLQSPNYGVRNIFNYGKDLANKEKHVHISEMEDLIESFNDLDIGLVYDYNEFVSRSRFPVLKILTEVIPYEVVKKIKTTEEPQIKEVVEEEVKENFVQDDINTLEGAKTNNIVLLLDISGSMRKNGKLKRLQSSINHFIDILRDEDHITVITYSGSPKVIFESYGSKNKDKLKAKINQIQTKAGTDFEKGLTKAYDACDKHWENEGNNRIVIATDGAFKLKEVERELIKNNVAKGVNVSTFHYLVNTNNKEEKEILLEISDLGKGGYFPILKDEDAVKALILEAKKEK